jgi:predicted transcriptional regulator
MRDSRLPSIRVEPELRAHVERALHPNETLSAFVEGAVREAIRRRKTKAEFIARALASLEETRRTGQFHTIEEVIEELRARLAQAKAQARERQMRGCPEPPNA